MNSNGAAAIFCVCENIPLAWRNTFGPFHTFLLSGLCLQTRSAKFRRLVHLNEALSFFIPMYPCSILASRLPLVLYCYLSYGCCTLDIRLKAGCGRCFPTYIPLALPVTHRAFLDDRLARCCWILGIPKRGLCHKLAHHCSSVPGLVAPVNDHVVQVQNPRAAAR
ncbi:hypothetical protein BDV37DRAFT_128142 [Aspergillus pseudonomiae]|uniref:Uncharacterized protein n=1 Tax=Aspergillus pseudonomiae TaxID=1506151 RepID=A0A5N7DC47_9EURO|nr:uncharacterized protein BDV37DRAFT_128142 [Aspergillus pseudonomiae]KAE8403809.1 hypothetical protein BDV37DRAFT_128142 [Aspergillus pseudonomiae]